MVRHFPAASPSAAKRSTVASVLFTVTSSQGHVNHVFTIMMLPHSPNSEIFIAQNNTFFIATPSVVKDAADDPDCQGLREQWYYLRFYVLWIRNLFTHGQTLPGRFAIGNETIDRRFGVVYRDVITGSRESRVHHYDAPSFTEFWNLYCPEQYIFHSDAERR